MTIICLLPSMLINAQVIDWKSFNEKTMSDEMFRILNEYTYLENGYSLIRSSVDHHKIYKLIKKNNGKLLLDDLSSEINEIVPGSSVGILDRISCNDLKEYQEIARSCITDWSKSPSDAFFMIGWGKLVEIASYYSNRTNSIYISCVFQN